MASYKELRVWQKAMDLVIETYQLFKFLPKEENYGLRDQMRRAVVSIPSNIAEGQARKNKKEFIHFLYIAQGSLAELQTQLEICLRLGYLQKDQITNAFNYSEETGKMISNLIKNLQLAANNQQPMTNDQ